MDSLKRKDCPTFYNIRPDEGFQNRNESKIFFMRNFNNWIKSTLIDEYLTLCKKKLSERTNDISVLDMGCGKGGDQKKWSIGQVKHVTFADLAPNSVEDCRKRFKDERFRYEADFHTIDLTKELVREKLGTNEPCFDFISTQFVLHYSFKSYECADTFLRNAAELLRIGGYFIGTTVNGARVVELCRQSPKQTISNDVFKIEFDSSIDLNGKDGRSIPLFGAEYHFTLDENVDCPEYLVYFPLLIELAKKHGLELVEQKTFKAYFDKSFQRLGSILLKRMKALECYSVSTDPNVPRVNLATGERQYQHADEFLNRTSNNDNDCTKKTSCRTLSAQEWEVASLYIVFAFQKTRHVSYD